MKQYPIARSLTEQAMHAIRAELLSGRWASGSWLRVEEIAEWLGMSPSPVREALRTLASEGLVVPMPQRGFQVPPITVADLQDTYRLRLMLDPLAVELAIPRLTPEHTKSIDRAFDELTAAYATEDRDAIGRAHRRFHFGIYDAAESPWLVRFLSMLWSNSQRYQHLSLPLRGNAAERATAHRRILEACKSGDAESAAALMRRHLEQTFTIVRALLAEGEPGEAGLP